MGIETELGVCVPVAQIVLADPQPGVALEDLTAIVDEDGNFVIDNDTDCNFIVE